MKFSDIMNIAATGLRAQRTRMTVTASNIANAQTTRTREGGPYERRDPVFEAERIGEGFATKLERKIHSVDVARIVTDDRPPIMRFLPDHPDANAQGFVAFPNVNLVEEQANLVGASRSYQANLLVMQKLRSMTEALLRVGQQ